ncbi:MAG: hypothetical protein PWP65_1120 [Clostridia bacterium]|nr:hypothetical protein [Clostridia bacterium]
MSNNHRQTAELSAFTSALSYARIPEPALERARLCLLDYLGAALAGSRSREAGLARAFVARVGGNPQASIIGTDLKTSVPLAALANGVAGHVYEVDDAHRYATGLHPGATVIPAVLAAAEYCDSKWGDLLTAIVAGYEVAGRVGRAINPSHRYRGFHSTGTVACLGAAAGVARILGLGAKETAWALGLAGSMAGGLFEFLQDGSMSKLLHAGHAAAAGVTAALMAAEGFTGPSTVLEGKEGFCRAFADEYNLELLTQGLGERFEMENVYFKRHAACGHSFAAIDAALELRRQLQGKEKEIRRVTVKTYRAAAVLDKKKPETTREAKFSLPFVIALAIIKGRAGYFDFVPANLQDQEVLALAAKVDVSEDAEINSTFPQKRTAVLEIEMQNGDKLAHSVDIPRGMPENPLSKEEVVEKFKSLAGIILSEVEVVKIAGEVLGAENDGKVSSLLSLI